MPLNTQIIRDGKAIEVPWSDYHVTAMILAAAFEQGKAEPPEEISYPTEACGISPQDAFLLTNYAVIAETIGDGYTLKHAHNFTFTYGDGRPDTLFLMPGDVLKAWRT